MLDITKIEAHPSVKKEIVEGVKEVTIFVNFYKSHDIMHGDYAEAFLSKKDADACAFNSYTHNEYILGEYKAPDGYSFAQNDYGDFLLVPNDSKIGYHIFDMSLKSNGEFGVIGLKINLIKV